MRVRQPTSDVLIAEDLSVRPRLTGVALVALGMGAAYMPAAVLRRGDWHNGWLAVLLALVGIAVFRASGSKMLLFDRTAGVVRVRTRALLGTAALVYPLPDIADAVLELQPVGDGRSFYRAAFVMHDGTHRAWASYAIGGYPAIDVPVVKAVRQFLGTGVSPTAPDGTPAIPSRTDPTSSSIG
jgi:hypothetical protein